MSKYTCVAVTIAPTSGNETRFVMRVESPLFLLTTVIEQTLEWRRRHPGCTVQPSSSAASGMALHVFGPRTDAGFSVYVSEVEADFMTPELRTMKPTPKADVPDFIDEKFRSFDADFTVLDVPEAA